jgi:hypothetical protein
MWNCVGYSIIVFQQAIKFCEVAYIHSILFDTKKYVIIDIKYSAKNMSVVLQNKQDDKHIQNPIHQGQLNSFVKKPGCFLYNH